MYGDNKVDFMMQRSFGCPVKVNHIRRFPVVIVK